MRTTVDLDRDVLLAAKAIAQQRQITLSKAISELLRQALTSKRADLETRDGVPLFPRLPNRRGAIVTMELVNRLRDE
jgi:hypothetical protein